MGMLTFFPWLALTEPIEVGTFRLHPLPSGSQWPDGVTASMEFKDAMSLMSPYRVHAPHAERLRTLLQLGVKPVGADLDATEIAAVFRLSRHLAVAGLASRRFEGHPLGEYSANGHYQAIVQQFPDPFTGSVVVAHRRKDGATRVNITAGAQCFQIPEHLVGQVNPTIDLGLLQALEAAHAAMDEEQWGPYEASITQFLLANSDSPDVHLDAESISTYAALERLVSASANKADFTHKVLACFAPVDLEPAAPEIQAQLLKAVNPRAGVERWLNDLYKLRGNAGHGYPPSKLKNAVWDQGEHLLAGAFVYPLALKCQLHRAGFYKLTSRDIVYIVGLDLLLTSRPLRAPATGGSLPPEATGLGGWQINMATLDEVETQASLRRVIEAEVGRGTRS